MIYLFHSYKFRRGLFEISKAEKCVALQNTYLCCCYRNVYTPDNHCVKHTFYTQSYQTDFRFRNGYRTDILYIKEFCILNCNGYGVSIAARQKQVEKKLCIA